MGAFWVGLNIPFFIFLSRLSAKGAPLCGSDKKGSQLSCSSSQMGVWPKLTWGGEGGGRGRLRFRVVTWTAWVWDVIHGSCYKCDDFWPAGTQRGHRNALQQHSLEASTFTLFLFMVMKKAQEKGDSISCNSFSPEHFKHHCAAVGSGSLSYSFLPPCLSSHMYQCECSVGITISPRTV